MGCVLNRRRAIIPIILVLSSLCLTGCRDGLSGGQYVGKWIATSAEYNGEEISKEELDFSFSLEENGTAIIKSGQTSNAGTWTARSNGVNLKNSEGNVMKLIGYGDQLTWEFSGQKVYFDKQ